VAGAIVADTAIAGDTAIAVDTATGAATDIVADTAVDSTAHLLRAPLTAVDTPVAM
jgi:hypothetical protein